ncbi:MAG: MBL fold metallo-hydrolase [Cyclobacteriaceae bacterium]|nr:MBL fold metallo-hydrolase [Cyclobacteriaceae bacterium]
MLQLKSFTFNPFEENTYVVWDETGAAAIVDPGCYDASERAQLHQFVRQQELHITHLLNTHCHIDHVLGNAWVKKEYGVKLGIHAEDARTLRAVSTYASNYGFPAYEGAEPDYFLEENQPVAVGNTTWQVLFVPGHAPGHIAFFHAESRRVIGGDVLFRNSIGRTDLPGGDYETLLESIHQKLFTLPDEVTVFPGHGPSTTIGYEKVTNPYCAITTRS